MCTPNRNTRHKMSSANRLQGDSHVPNAVNAYTRSWSEECNYYLRIFAYMSEIRTLKKFSTEQLTEIHLMNNFVSQTFLDLGEWAIALHGMYKSTLVLISVLK